MSLTNPKLGGWASKEKLLSTQMTSVVAELMKTADFSGGDTKTPSAPIIINGTAKWQLGDKLAYTSRAVTRGFALGGWLASTTNFGWAGGTAEPTLTTLVASIQQLIIPLNLPHGQVLDSVSFYIAGPTANVVTPATMPALKIYRRVISTGVSTQIGAQANDVYGSSAAFKALHAITKSAIAHTIDNTSNIYMLVYESEGGGGGALAGEVLHGYTATCTITGQSEWR